MGYFSSENPYSAYGSTKPLTPDEINQVNDFYGKLDQEEYDRKKREEEQARIETLNNRPTSQKIWEYIKGQANYAKDNPVQAVQNLGMGIIATEKRVGDVMSAPFTAGIYNKTNEDSLKKRQEQDQKFMAVINNPNSSEKAKKDALLIMNQGGNDQIDVLKEVPSLNKTPGQIVADFAMLGVDIFGATTLVGGLAKDASGMLVKSGVKGFMKNVGVDAVKEGGWKVAQKAVGEEAAKKLATKAFFKTVVEGAGWGAAYGGEGTYSEGGSWEEIKKATEMGAIVGGGLAVAGHGLVSGVKWAKDRPMNKIRAQVTNDFEQHLITGVTDHNIATELLDNGAKSVKVSASLPESFDHLGVDLKGKDTLIATEEGQRAIAGTTVAEKMSPNAKKAVYNEIVSHPEILKVEKGDSVDSVVQRGIETILANGGETRNSLNLTSKYTDSVLGVINPKLAEVESMVAGKVAEGATPPAEVSVTPTENTPIIPETQPKTPTKPVAEVSPKSDAGAPTTAPKEELFAEKTGQPRKMPDALAYGEKGAIVFDEMANAKAGFKKRGAVKVGEGGGFETVSQKSTFPDWVPKEKVAKENGKLVDLRDRKLFDEVQQHILEGTVPTDEKQLMLYDLYHNEVRKRMDMPALEFPVEGKIIKSQRLSPEKPVKSTSGEMADSQFSRRYNEFYGYDRKTIQHEVAHDTEQFARSKEMVNGDYKRAIRIATGLEKADSVLTDAVALRVSEKAIFEGDAVTEFAVYKATTARRTLEAQNLRIGGNFASANPAYKAVQETNSYTNKAFEAKTGTKPDVAITTTEKTIDSHVQEIAGDKFAKFINDHPC